VKLNATEADLHAAAEALKLAAILDDRAPNADKARIAAWAEKFHQHQLHRNDLLDGLQVFYDAPSERAIQIGDLIHHARQVRRDRNEREEAKERERRGESHDIKAADEMGAVADLVIASPNGPVVKTKRLIAAENRLQTCTNKHEAIEAIREFFAAKTEARQP
jgi:hypothetical protein